MILPKLKEVQKHLSFAKKAFTKGSFRYVQQYVSGLIALNKKTVKKISDASVGNKHHSAINRILTEAKFKQELLEQKYLRKVKYILKGHTISLLLDDTLVKREGKKVEETQNHFDHNTNGYLKGHQFFTAILHTAVVQLPLFPKLYSKKTDSKIEMAQETIEDMLATIKIDTILFDSWYSDKKIIKKCMTRNVRVICGIKTNRKISFETGEWESLKDFSNTIEIQKLKRHTISNKSYRAGLYNVKLSGIPKVRMIISHEWSKKKKKWSKIHLISTNTDNSVLEILSTYKIRWHIETYHRDIKQNLGFAKACLRKKEGIVSHSILVSLAYALLRMYMFHHGLSMTIGECCAHLQQATMYDFLREIVEIDDKQTRLNVFEEAFKRKSAKV
jgi:hypothetical protein